MTITIIYSLITRNKKTVLSEYTEYSGNFQQISLHLLSKLNSNEALSQEMNSKMVIDYDMYKFYFITEDSFYFMCLVKKEDVECQKCHNEDLIVEFLENLKNSFFNLKLDESKKASIKEEGENSDIFKAYLKSAPAYSIKEAIPVIKTLMDRYNRKIRQCSAIRKSTNSSETRSKIFNEVESKHKMTMIVKAPTTNSDSIEEELLDKKTNKKKWVKKLIIWVFLLLLLAAIVVTIIYLTKNN